MSTATTLDLSFLDQINGTNQTYTNRAYPGFVYTDAIKMLSGAGMHWFVSGIMVKVRMSAKLMREDFLVIKLNGKTGMVRYYRTNHATGEDVCIASQKYLACENVDLTLYVLDHEDAGRPCKILLHPKER